MNNTKYEKKLVDFIEKNRMRYDTNEMVKLINEKYGRKISTKTLRKYYYRHNLEFKRIYNRTDKCVFAKRVGFESPPDKNGLIKIKINDKQWQYKQRYLYEKYNNTKIDENCVIIFADGDKTNFNKENLIAVPREIAGTFYIISKGEIKNKELTMTGLKIAEVVHKVYGLKNNI